MFVVPNQTFGPGTEAAGDALCLKDSITQLKLILVRKLSDHSSVSVACQNGWGNHGGVGHSSKRIWLAALPRGIKTGWADQPLLLSMFQCFMIKSSLWWQKDTALSHVTTRFPLCWPSWGKRSPSARPSSLCRYFQSKFVLHHSVYWFFWSCPILSEATFIGRTSKCWTTKLLRQVCSHHNRPDEGSNKQFSGECSFETSIVLRRVVAKY